MKTDESTVDIRNKGILELDEKLLDRDWVEEIEDRYRIENEMINAVTAGNAEKALEFFKEQGDRHYERYTNNIENVRVGLITFNTLCRRAVAAAHVHPAYIDRISHDYADRIMKADFEKDPGFTARLCEEMIRKYCLLVRNFSLKKYSAVVQDAINYIEFHYDDQLTLTSVADAIGVNNKYLSSQFKKETDTTITDYINNKRVREAMRLLMLTDAPVRDISERVGIYDENYFSRIFKKYSGVTPSKYRRDFKKGDSRTEPGSLALDDMRNS